MGEGSTVLSGVTIGNGAVIAAKSVVTKDVLPYAIVGGNPAKVIKRRFDDETIIKLEEIKWWEWDISKIMKHINLLLNDDIKKFIKVAEEE